jgi:cephalosporin-C deacetylase
MASAESIRNFWEKTLALLTEVRLDALVESVEPEDALLKEGTNKSRFISRVTMSSFENRRIRAWYALPRGAPRSAGWPAILELPGYSGIQPPSLQLLHYGYAVLTLYPRSQGESLKEWQIDSDTKLTYHITDRERYYYRGAFMDCVRGMDFLASRPEIDANRIGVLGISQGSGLSLATAALDRRVHAAVAAVPWLCNFPVAVERRFGPYVELNDYIKQHPEQRSAALETLAYFDPLNLGAMIACPTLMVGAADDEVHPLAAAMPVFENIRSLKSMLVYADLQHEFHTDFSGHAKHWLDRYLR